LQRPAAVIEDAENQLTGSSRDLLQSLYGKLAQLDKKIADEDRRRPEAAARTRRLLDGTPYPESSQIRSLRSLAAAKVPSPFPANTSTAPPAPLLTPSTRSARLSLVIFAARSERGTPPL